jgi:hypothetical protein
MAAKKESTITSNITVIGDQAMDSEEETTYE